MGGEGGGAKWRAVGGYFRAVVWVGQRVIVGILVWVEVAVLVGVLVWLRGLGLVVVVVVIIVVVGVEIVARIEIVVVIVVVVVVVIIVVATTTSNLLLLLLLPLPSPRFCSTILQMALAATDEVALFGTNLGRKLRLLQRSVEFKEDCVLLGDRDNFIKKLHCLVV